MINIPEMYNFDDFYVVITGGAGVLGSEMVRTLLQLNAKVAVLTRDTSKAAFAENDNLLLLKSDVTNRELLEENAQQIEEKFPRIDALINAAGGNSPQATTKEQSFFDLPSAALTWVTNLNLLGAILPCQVFGKKMLENKRGNIINISSMAAMKPLTNIPAYSAAKAGLSNFTQWLAVHMAQEYSARIRVNAIAPGFFLTEQNRFLLTTPSGELTERGKTIVAHTPMGRFGEPQDLVGTLLWLLSDASRFVTGTVIPVDGGFSAFAGV